MKQSKLFAVLYGWVIILFLVLISGAFMSLIIRFTMISDFTISYITLIIGLLVLFFGGLITGLKGKDMGLVLGFTVGAGFSLLTFLIQFLGYNELFTMKQSLFHMTYILSAMSGAVVGVNLWNNKEATS